MKKKDETLKWIDEEMKRVKNNAIRSQEVINGKLQSALDPTSQKQLDDLNKQKGGAAHLLSTPTYMLA